MTDHKPAAGRYEDALDGVEHECRRASRLDGFDSAMPLLPTHVRLSIATLREACRIADLSTSSDVCQPDAQMSTKPGRVIEAWGNDQSGRGWFAAEKPWDTAPEDGPLVRVEIHIPEASDADG